MKAIAAVDKNWGIGFKGKLLERIPEDMKFFTQMTIGKIVVMGRETFESLPGKRPLRDRANIILSSSMRDGMEGITICKSIDRLFEELIKYPDEDIFIAGGASVYRQMLPYCSEAYITKFSNVHEADSFFPVLEREESWTPITISKHMVWNDMEYSRVKYINKRTMQRIG